MEELNGSKDDKSLQNQKHTGKYSLYLTIAFLNQERNNEKMVLKAGEFI